MSDASALFARDGYWVARGVLSTHLCTALMHEITRAFRAAAWDDVHEPDARAHCTLPLNAVTWEMLGEVVEHGAGFLHAALPRQKYLVELSSITTFPGAVAQGFHRDQSTRDGAIVSVFVNPLTTAGGVGALAVHEASQHAERLPDGEPLVLEVPAGSLLFMNSKLWHQGTANESANGFRPVAYCSFGDSDLDGPTYSIRPGYRRRFTLDAFTRHPLTPDTIVRAIPETWLGLRPGPEGTIPSLVLMRGDVAEGEIELGADTAFMMRLAATLQEDEPTLRTITNSVAQPIERVATALERLRTIGFVYWRA